MFFNILIKDIINYFIFYFIDAINVFDKGERYVSGPFQTAKIFATYPNDHLSTLGGFIDQAKNFYFGKNSF